MEWPEDQIEELKDFVGEVQIAEEGGKVYFLIPILQLPEQCKPNAVRALLCPTPRDGYKYRLFFAQIIEKPQGRLNWNSKNQRILEENWFAFSWRINRNNLRLSQIVADHLRGLR
ncbi:MAG TPA: hypothetical protein VE912_25005 [Bacteroidales bacterium]|nr:hypothetical protein [Bacteroidales bacterium]